MLIKNSSQIKLLWFIPVLLGIHNVEEALTMPQWMDSHLSLLREKVFIFQHMNFSEPQLYISLFLVTVVPILFVWFCLREPLKEKRIQAVLILQGIIFWNALVPHVSGLFLLGMYNPGTITAVVIHIPFSVFIFYRFMNENILTMKSVRNILIVAGILYLPLVYLNHLLAELILRMVR